MGILLSLVVTRHSVGLDTDSGPYIGAAYNLRHARGLTTPFTFYTSPYGPVQAVGFRSEVPLTHFPPLFPLLLAGLASFRLSISSAARVMNSLLLGINLVLVGGLALRLTKLRSWPVALLAAVLLFGPGSPTLTSAGRITWLSLHSSVLSEPLFLIFALTGLLLVHQHVATESRRTLYAAASCCALAC
jgi:hypothetical protein